MMKNVGNLVNNCSTVRIRNEKNGVYLIVLDCGEWSVGDEMVRSLGKGASGHLRRALLVNRSFTNLSGDGG